MKDLAYRYAPFTINEGMTMKELRKRIELFADDAVIEGKFEEVASFVRFAVKVKGGEPRAL